MRSGKDIQAGFPALPRDASKCPEVGTGEPAFMLSPDSIYRGGRVQIYGP